MKNFKPGQKVVYTGNLPPGKTFDNECIFPELNSIITIERACDCGCNKAWHISEFPWDKFGRLQVMNDALLEPIQSITILLHEIKLEPKKVIESQPIHAQ